MILVLKIKLPVVLYPFRAILQKDLKKTQVKKKYAIIEIAKGSAAELITQIYIGIEIDNIDKNTGLTWIKELNEILSMLSGLKNKHVSLNP